ncbi:MAG: sigma-70 family RNA polymerase sigma factor [Bacteroidota bacterium]
MSDTNPDSIDQETVTRLLNAVQEGDERAMDKLFGKVYEELHKLAKANRRNWVGGDYTMNTTALVHEAYIKLAGQKNQNWDNRNHFMMVASKAMRHIMINYANKRRTKKRGGDIQKVSIPDQDHALKDEIALTDDQADKFWAIENALKKLEKEQPRKVQIIECKFFGGMSNEETATALGISISTVKRDWAMAQAWLYREAKEELD